MDSFYGGRPGASFIITKTYSSVQDMINDFQTGADCTDVHFDEYVMITVDPNDIQHRDDNGKIFRRGYDYSNTFGGAEQIGKITGPPGELSTIDILNYDAVTTGAANANAVIISGQGDINDGTLIRGKDENGFHDTIVWQYYEILENENNKYTNHVKLGFKIPCPVFDFDVNFISSDTPGGIEKIEDENDPHLFYHKWQLNIPAPLKGDSVAAIEVIKCGRPINPQTHEEIMDQPFQNINVDYSTFEGTIPDVNEDDAFNAFWEAVDKTSTTSAKDLLSLKKKTYDGYFSQIILAYKVDSYNPDGSVATSHLYYLDDYPIVKNIDISDNGFLIFTLPDGTTVNSSSAIVPSIENIEVDEYGRMFFSWKKSDGTTTKTMSDIEIPWIENMKFDSLGNFKIQWNTIEKDENNREKLNEDGTYKKKESNVEINGAKFITNLITVDNGLYMTYLGISDEIWHLLQQVNARTNESIQFDNLNTEQLQLIGEEKSYYKDIENNIWYKKIFDIDTYVNRAVENSPLFKSSPIFTYGDYIDEYVVIDCVFKCDANYAPGNFSLIGSFALSKPVSETVGIIKPGLITAVNFPDAALQINYNTETGTFSDYEDVSGIEALNTYFNYTNGMIFKEDTTYYSTGHKDLLETYLASLNQQERNLAMERFKLENIMYAALMDENGHRLMNEYSQFAEKPEAYPETKSDTTNSNLFRALATLVKGRFLNKGFSRNSMGNYEFKITDSVLSTIHFLDYTRRVPSVFRDNSNSNNSRKLQFNVKIGLSLHGTLQ